MLEILRNAASYLVAISVLVAFHEFGHFWAARRLGVKVLRFSVGIGKPLWKRVGRDGIEYIIAAIPLGGYVKLLDEREGPVDEKEAASAFNRKPVATRIAIFAAGPAFNFVLTLFLFWATFVIGVPGMKPILGEPPASTLAAAAGLHDREVVVSSNGRPIVSWNALRSDILYNALTQEPLPLVVQDAAGQQRQVLIDLRSARLDPRYLLKDIGLTPYQPPIPPVIGEVVHGSAAERAGLRTGDRVTAIDAVAVDSFQQLRNYVAARAGQHVAINLRRGEDELKLDVTLDSAIVEGKVIGRLGAGNQRVANTEELWHDLYLVERQSPVDAIGEAIRQTGRETVVVSELMLHMLLGDISVKNLSGPIGTAEAAGFAASIGLSTFLYFIAFVSLNVGIFNLFPLPILDGGQIVNCLIEAVKGSPLSERATILVQQIGLALLILIMGFAFFNDITRTFG